MVRVPFFLLFCFNKETPKQKGQKGTTQEPSLVLVLELWEFCKFTALIKAVGFGVL